MPVRSRSAIAAAVLHDRFIRNIDLHSKQFASILVHCMKRNVIAREKGDNEEMNQSTYDYMEAVLRHPYGDYWLSQNPSTRAKVLQKCQEFLVNPKTSQKMLDIASSLITKYMTNRKVD
jgi:hypothetical protein